MRHRATLIEGDGIGPEVTGATCRILEAAGARVEWERAEAGEAAWKQHGDALPEAIVAAVTSPPEAHPLPTVVSGDHRAVVGIIVGPAARWVHAREAVRHGRWHRLMRAIRLASLRTLSQSVRVREGARRSKGYRAIFAHPDGDALAVIRVRAAGWTDGVRLGFTYVTGTWERARGIETNSVAEVTLASERPVFALFDGEPVYLPPDATLRAGKTRLKFVTTKGSTA